MSKNKYEEEILEEQRALTAAKEAELAEKQEKVNHILRGIIPEEQMKNYNKLSDSIGVMFGLMFVLEEEKIFKNLGEETTEKIKESLSFIVNYAGKAIETEIGSENAEEIRKQLIKNNLV